MDGRRAAALMYFASALLCPMVFWLLTGASSRFAEFIVLYELVPFSIVGLLLGTTRGDSPAGGGLELVSAGLWGLTLLATALWYPLFNTVERMGSGLIDAVAVTVGFAAVALGSLAARVLLAARSKSLVFGAGWSLQAFGIAVLALYLARTSLLLYATTRLTLSGGIARITQEMTLRVAVFAVVALALTSRQASPQNGFNGRTRRNDAPSINEAEGATARRLDCRAAAYRRCSADNEWSETSTSGGDGQSPRG